MRAPKIKEIPGTLFGIDRTGQNKWRYYVYTPKAGERGETETSEEAEEKIVMFLLKSGYKVQMTLFARGEDYQDDPTER